MANQRQVDCKLYRRVLLLKEQQQFATFSSHKCKFCCLIPELIELDSFRPAYFFSESCYLVKVNSQSDCITREQLSVNNKTSLNFQQQSIKNTDTLSVLLLQ